MTTGLPFDDDVAEGIRAKDPDALAAVWRSVAPDLIAWLRTQLRHDQDAEDVAMETFRELISRCDTVTGGPEEIRGWLFRAAYHNVLDHRRTRSRRPTVMGNAAAAGAAGNGSGTLDPGDAVVASDLRRRLGAALDLLAADQAEVLTMRFLGQLSAPEIALVLGRTEGSVRQLQHRGVQRLAQMVKDGTVPFEIWEAP